MRRDAAPDAADLPAGLRPLARPTAGAFAFALLGALCFLNALPGDFTYDDQAIVRNNERIRSLANLRDIWLRDWWSDTFEPEQIVDPTRDRLYRPLSMQTMAFDYSLYGLWPTGFRLTNLLLHAACCGLVWLLARRLVSDLPAAMMAAALFAVHPVHCEAIAQIVGRAEALAALFLLLGLLTLLPRRAAGLADDGALPGLGRTAAAAGLFLLALLAKETAICYPLVALLALHGTLAAPRPAARWWLVRSAVLLAPLLIYFPLRLYALEGHLIRKSELEPVLNPLFEANWVGRLTLPLTILGHYARLMFAPAHLQADYGMGVVPSEPRFDAMMLTGCIAAVGLLVALRGYTRRDGPGTVALLAGMTLASYALISNTVLLIGVSVAERLAYWPSAPALMLAAVVLRRGWLAWARPGGPLAGSRGLLLGAGGLLLAALAARTVTRNADWISDQALFSVDARSGTRSVQINTAHGRMLVFLAARSDDPALAEEMLEEAERHLKIALQEYPRHAVAHVGLATVYVLRGQSDLALRHFETARQLDPRNRDAQSYLLEMRGQKATRTEEIAELEAAVAEAPDDADRRMSLGRALLAAGRHHPARGHFERAAELRPGDPAVLRLLGQVLLLDKDYEGSVRAFEAALAADPTDWETACNLAAAIVEIDPVRSLRYAQLAHRLRPEDLRTRIALGEALIVNGQREAGLSELRRAVGGLRSDDPLSAALRHRIENLERGKR